MLPRRNSRNRRTNRCRRKSRLALEWLPPTEEAKTDNILESLAEPQCGHLVPFHLLERTRISLSCSHLSQ